MNDTSQPAAVVWWQSRTFLVQAIAILFSLASILKFDIGERLGMSQEQFLALVLGILPTITILIRLFLPNPPVVASAAAVAVAERAQAKDEKVLDAAAKRGPSKPSRPSR